MMRQPDMTIGLNLSTYLTAFDGDPSSYVMQIHGQMVSIGESEPQEIGSLNVILCRLGEALNDKVSFYEVLDSFSETAPYLELFEDDDEWSDSVQKVCSCEGGIDLLVMDRVEVKEEYRGNGFGLIAVRSCIKAFGTGCGVVALKPFPLQYEGAFNSKTGAAEDPRAFQKHKLKLTRYWARLGFKRLRNGLMVMDPVYCLLPRMAKS